MSKRRIIFHLAAIGAVTLLLLYVWHRSAAISSGGKQKVVPAAGSIEDESRLYAYHKVDVSQPVSTSALETNEGVSRSDTITEITTNVSLKDTLWMSLLPSKQPPIKNKITPTPVEKISPIPIPFMGYYNCSNTHCTEFLTENNWIINTKCRGPNKSPHMEFPGKCHFMNGRNRSATFLMSYPGSGNTWVRGLLEQATGICTGSVYCDGNLKQGGFNGENLVSGTVLVTKSHSAMWPPHIHSGILLVRNPLDAYVSEWNRQHSTGHVGQANKALFGTNPQWDRFTKHFSMSPWISYFKWLVKGHQTGCRVLVVRYEDLKSDLMTQMKRMLDFLGVPYSDEALQERMSQDFGKFHRKHNPASDLDRYTAEQRNGIKGLVREAIEFLQANNNGVTYGIEEYLQ